MTEDKALNLVLRLWEKRLVPAHEREEAETRAIQTVAMLYLHGYEVVDKKQVIVPLGENGIRPGIKTA